MLHGDGSFPVYSNLRLHSIPGLLLGSFFRDSIPIYGRYKILRRVAQLFCIWRVTELLFTKVRSVFVKISRFDRRSRPLSGNIGFFLDFYCLWFLRFCYQILLGQSLLLNLLKRLFLGVSEPTAR